MTFENFYESVQETENACDTFLEKVRIFIEGSYREYEINCKEAELKVMRESGTDDDLAFLEAAAQEGLVNRIGAGMKKAYEAIVLFIKGIVESVTSLFGAGKGKNALSKMESASKSPALKAKKIPVENVQGSMKAADEAQGKLDKLLAKFKTKNYKDSDVAAINEINEEYQSKRSKFMKAGAVTLSVASIVGLTTVIVKKLSTVQSAENEAGLPKSVPVPDQEESAKLLQRVMDTKFQVGKSKLSDMTRAINGFYHKVVKGEVEIDNPADTTGVKKESTNDEIDSQTYLENLHSELFESTEDIGGDDVEESFEPDSYLDKLEKEIDGEDIEKKDCDCGADCNCNKPVENPTLSVTDYLEKIEKSCETPVEEQEGPTEEESIDDYIESVLDGINDSDIDEYLDSLL